MKHNLIKKITALTLSVMLAFSATTVIATTVEDDGYRSEYIDYNADYSKSDINTLFRITPIGGKFTPESTERFSMAWHYASEVYEKPDATQEEINTAYIEFMEALERLESCNLDEDLLNLCYFYCCDMNGKYKEYFTEDSRKTLSHCETDAQVAILYENTQEGIDKITQEVVEKLRTLELEKENPDIVLWTELEQIDSYMQVYIEENSIPNTDYYYSKIPRFKDFNGYRLVSYYNLVVGPMFNVNRYGDYILEKNGVYTPSAYGYVLVNGATGDILTLDEAILNGIVDTDKLFESHLESPFEFNMHVIGDADCDNQLSVTDATYIQKICATLVEDSNTYEVGNFNDFNNDGEVNIIDATEIQKSLVQ